MTFNHISRLRESRLHCPRIARVTSLEELGTIKMDYLGYKAYMEDSLS